MEHQQKDAMVKVKPQLEGRFKNDEQDFDFELLPDLVIQRILTYIYCDLESCLSLAVVSNRIYLLRPTSRPAPALLLLMPTHGGKVIRKWRWIKRRPWKLRVPLDQKAECIEFIKALYRIFPDLKRIRVVDCDLVQLFLQVAIGHGLLVKIKSFEFIDTMALQDMRIDKIFRDIKQLIPKNGIVRYIYCNEIGCPIAFRSLSSRAGYKDWIIDDRHVFRESPLYDLCLRILYFLSLVSILFLWLGS